MTTANSKPSMRQAYFLALDVDQYLEDIGQPSLNPAEYDALLESICYLRTAKKREEFVERLQSWPRSKIVERTKQIAKLTKLLETLEFNR